ncbi:MULTISPECIES: four-carbon acid sugar kinase family protein [unclassified Halomonas]|uniref:four-carbon acid sugar kinase family protein n=1 Tax=unclassified Halomonas TaxID=2609666 RepID=UPI0007D97527|nr:MULTISPECIES: four-carbon acid sugar kinase family protein [unclassified Halomonas]MBT2786071.1 four-carbon acid sugar kinase family protein [Halomonas sp. ISL-106]MBT2797093.1 four-carbon acid sugar kinase family protein [Halomonas sp. ISL-104]OAL58476.1 hypothetical protein A6R74_06175 [Halomonas sp. ALS9]
MSGCRLAIIADDLSGALDTAAPFAARGADSRVVISLEALAATLEAWQDQWPDVIAVNTESRHLPAEQAALRVSEAVRLLTRATPEQWFKKVDSTMRGQVVAECSAVREALGIPLLLAPAVPAQGRTVRDAQVWVEGIPLADTAYQQDARSAPLVGPLDQAFAASGLPIQRYRPGQETPFPSADCIADSESDEELSVLYSLIMAADDKRALAGAAGLATALAQYCFGPTKTHFSALHQVVSVLYAVGSRSPRAGEQLDQLCKQWPDLAVINACQEPGDAAFPAQALHSCVVVPGCKEGVLTASEVAKAMAVQVASIASKQDAVDSLLFLTGGDVAMAVLTQLGTSYISVETEWSPGVALGYMDGNLARRVMTKAGGFGELQLLVRLHRQLSQRLASPPV